MSLLGTLHGQCTVLLRREAPKQIFQFFFVNSKDNFVKNVGYHQNILVHNIHVHTQHVHNIHGHNQQLSYLQIQDFIAESEHG